MIMIHRIVCRVPYGSSLDKGHDYYRWMMNAVPAMRHPHLRWTPGGGKSREKPPKAGIMPPWPVFTVRKLQKGFHCSGADIIRRTMSGKIGVPRNVYEELVPLNREVHYSSGDFSRIIAMAENRGYFRAAAWLRDHEAEYKMGFIHGFEPV
jgi:hypothetical protein